jgi:Response regulator containing CheY-like receiver, AAA-type ATPase, and DNA-binding domains
MKNATFREDLYYRLNVVKISLPALRERKADVILMAKTFLERYTIEIRKKIKGFNSQAIESIERYPWPGNVRELENRIKRAVIMSEGKKITIEDLEMGSTTGRKECIVLKDAREILEKELILKAIARNENNLTKAASDLGVSRPTLYDLMEKLGIPK